MKTSEVLQAWSSILAGRAPSLSIEITKECPLRCPGCYAFDAAHLGSGVELRQLSDFKGDDLVTRIMALIDSYKPLHVSLVGGDPLVRYRELELILPQIEARGIHTQVVTSAFRVIPAHWKDYKKLNVVVSIDGLQPERDLRTHPEKHQGCPRHHSLHHYFADRRPSRLPGRIFTVLEQPAADCQGVVQSVYATAGRDRCGDPVAGAESVRDG